MHRPLKSCVSELVVNAFNPFRARTFFNEKDSIYAERHRASTFRTHICILSSKGLVGREGCTYGSKRCSRARYTKRLVRVYTTAAPSGDGSYNQSAIGPKRCWKVVQRFPAWTLSISIPIQYIRWECYAQLHQKSPDSRCQYCKSAAHRGVNNEYPLTQSVVPIMIFFQFPCGVDE